MGGSKKDVDRDKDVAKQTKIVQETTASTQTGPRANNMLAESPQQVQAHAEPELELVEVCLCTCVCLRVLCEPGIAGRLTGYLLVSGGVKGTC